MSLELVLPPPKLVMRRSEPIAQEFGRIEVASDAVVPAVFQIAQFFLSLHHRQKPYSPTRMFLAIAAVNDRQPRVYLTNGASSDSELKRLTDVDRVARLD